MMRSAITLLMLLGLAIGTASAQGPRTKAARKGAAATPAASLSTQMMRFDKDKDGKLTKAEVTDPRLSRIFARADADKDGVVTREELSALEAEETPAGGREGDRPPGPGPGGRGYGGPGGPGGRGPGGPGGGRPGGLTGEIIPPHVRDELELTDAQQKDLDALQKDVDTKLAKILNADQKKQLESMMRRRGPGGPGGPGGPPRGEGFDGPGGPPPGGEGFEGGPPPRERGFGGPDGPPPQGGPGRRRPEPNIEPE